MGSRHGLEIRAAQAGDAPGLAELLGAAGHVVAVTSLVQRIEALRHGSGAALVAVEWEPPSGLVVLHWYRGLDADAPVAQITTLVVGPDERRRGIGRLLVKAASQAARVAGCGSLQMLATPDLPGLDAFRAATGFEQAGTFYGRPLRKGR